jgi:uncharacterized protein DUF6343
MTGHADRAGTEPMTARSPLRMRLGLALFGVVVCAVAATWFAAEASGRAGTARTVLTALSVVAALAAAVAVADLAVRVRRLRRARRPRPRLTARPPHQGW